MEKVVSDLGIAEMLEKDVSSLSGGELQLFAIAAVLLKECDFYFFDVLENHSLSYPPSRMIACIEPKKTYLVKLHIHYTTKFNNFNFLNTSIVNN